MSLISFCVNVIKSYFISVLPFNFYCSAFSIFEFIAQDWGLILHKYEILIYRYYVNNLLHGLQSGFIKICSCILEWGLQYNKNQKTMEKKDDF